MSVLLLNATYEPLRVLTLKRAVVLMLQDKVDVIETGEGYVSSADVQVPRPEVIRLRYYVKIPFAARIPLTNRAVLNRDRYRCAYESSNRHECTGRGTTIDHIVPKARGGKHEWTNVVASCKRCNARKADIPLGDLGWRLDFEPTVPATDKWIVVAKNPKKSWGRWLDNQF